MPNTAVVAHRLRQWTCAKRAWVQPPLHPYESAALTGNGICAKLLPHASQVIPAFVDTFEPLNQEVNNVIFRCITSLTYHLISSHTRISHFSHSLFMRYVFPAVILPQGNQELLVVKDKVERPQVTLG